MDPFRVSDKVSMGVRRVPVQGVLALSNVRLVGLDLDALHNVQSLSVSTCRVLHLNKKVTLFRTTL